MKPFVASQTYCRNRALSLREQFAGGLGDSPGASVVKNVLPVQETWVRALGWEDPLEKELATHSRILVWTTLWTEELVGWSRKELDTTWQLKNNKIRENSARGWVER